MNIAALVLTVVFIADDASLPMLAMELVEQPGGRQLILAHGGPAAVADSSVLRDAGGRRLLPAGAFPMAPAGASVTPAVDGVIVTIDDAGALAGLWVPPPSATPPPKKTATSKKPPPVHPWPPPTLPVIGPRGVRLFLPAIVDGAPMSASLHVAGGVTVPGFAVAYTRVVSDPGLGGTVAVARGGDDIDVGQPRLVGIGSVCGADAGGPVLLRQTVAKASPARCEAGLEIRTLTGTRAGDMPARDNAARGIVLRRAMRAPASSTPPLPAPPQAAPSGAAAATPPKTSKGTP